ncbi:MAG TPA: arginine--tRNA ligase [Candidatus Desulfofervidus auxilii]|uniref:Arginine--tRNA ligase n=1 Tax=Desulfofervidus auxilii TaxID=1621989 RepID=A0A7V0IAX9_DESA2|nr:arginine--tRNA ligase [Candidatus Desulfofervidus auxilii]
MKKRIKELIILALKKTFEIDIDFNIEIPRVADYGDFATNVAFVLAKALKRPPYEIAKELVLKLPSCEWLEKVEIAGAGFINFFLKSSSWLEVIKEIIAFGEDYGKGEKKNIKVIVEFVSANPTGPLHIGHGRGAAVGDSLANILKFAGYDVFREYYINDVGKQIQTLGRSVYLRYLELLGKKVEFPSDCYQGGYVKEIAKEVLAKEGEKFKEMKEDDAVNELAKIASRKILEGIKTDLADFGVFFDCWFSERGLIDASEVKKVIEWFKKTGLVYEKDGALWFVSTRYGDEKDRVLVRANGDTTYFASDLAYHKNKWKRGFKLMIDVWGADHHGYVPRLKAGMHAMGYDPENLKILLVQLVHLKRGGKPVAMSTRAGEFITLKEVLDEVGKDAARFIFLTRSCDSHLDFDLEIAKQQTMENPVFYVQYAHARICSIEKMAKQKGLEIPPLMEIDLTPLCAPEEVNLMKLLSQFPDIIEDAARTLEPHRLTHYLTELSAGFHYYYNHYRILGLPQNICAARFVLAQAVKRVIKTGLNLLGVSTPEKM